MSNLLKGTEKQIAWSIKILEDLKKQFINKCHWFEGVDQEKLFDFIDSIEDCKVIIEKRNSIEYFVAEYKETLDCENYEEIRNKLLQDEKIVRSLIRNILRGKLSARVENEISIFNKRYQKLFLEESTQFINANFDLTDITIENVKIITENIDLNILVDNYFNTIIEVVKTEKTIEEIKFEQKEIINNEDRKSTIGRIKIFKNKYKKVNKKNDWLEIENLYLEWLDFSKNIYGHKNYNFKTVQNDFNNLSRNITKMFNKYYDSKSK